MILDLQRFLATERPYWEELNAILNRIEDDAYAHLSLQQVTRLQYLYQRASSALARLATFSAEPRTREFLESLVARAYAECHPNRGGSQRLRPIQWLMKTFPRTFRKHRSSVPIVARATIAGTVFGWAAITFDHSAKDVLMPFSTLQRSPVERVKEEESAKTDRLAGHKGTLSAELMTHNIQVSLLTFAMGASWGIGSTVLLFYNGVTLGAVAADYVNSGETVFLLGWLMPHGVIEIPAILVAGQAAFVLASALIGWGDSSTRRKRLRLVSGDILTLAGGSAVMLVWAGIIESFLSQYHQPVLPYSLKIAFGGVELSALIFFLWRAGRT